MRRQLSPVVPADTLGRIFRRKLGEARILRLALLGFDRSPAVLRELGKHTRLSLAAVPAGGGEHEDAEQDDGHQYDDGDYSDRYENGLAQQMKSARSGGPPFLVETASLRCAKKAKGGGQSGAAPDRLPPF